MREIKFRAWHKIANCMCLNATTDFLDRDCLDFMQYTGLKDKNGIEIYEGDIVKYYSLFEDKESFGVICFDECCFNIDDYYNLYNKRNCCEVVGNIYENKVEDYI